MGVSTTRRRVRKRRDRRLSDRPYLSSFYLYGKVFSKKTIASSLDFEERQINELLRQMEAAGGTIATEGGGGS